MGTIGRSISSTQTQIMTRAILAAIAGALCLAAGVTAQTTAPQWGQVG